jgi:hypothetical protein
MTVDDARIFEEAARRQHSRPTGNGHSANVPLAPLPYFRGEDYRQAAGRRMVVKGLMGAGEPSVIYGPPKSDKSFLITSCALAVAEGADQWFGFRINGSAFGSSAPAWSCT